MKPHIVRADFDDASLKQLEDLQAFLEQSTNIRPIHRADVIRKAVGDLHKQLIPAGYSPPTTQPPRSRT